MASKKKPNLGTVLMVDQDSELSSILAGYLTTLGYRTLFTTRVREALRKLENQKFTHVFLDTKLDPDNALDVLDELGRSGAPNSKTTVTLMSSDPEYQVPMTRVKRLTSILLKPFTLEEFALRFSLDSKKRDVI